MPLASEMLSRWGSTWSSPSHSKPASVHACCAAIRASWVERSRRRAFTRSMISEGSTATYAAIFTGSSSAHSSVMARTPEVPASMLAQVDARSPPRGVVAPRPVMTISVIVLRYYG